MNDPRDEGPSNEEQLEFETDEAAGELWDATVRLLKIALTPLAEIPKWKTHDRLLKVRSLSSFPEEKAERLLRRLKSAGRPRDAHMVGPTYQVAKMIMDPDDIGHYLRGAANDNPHVPDAPAKWFSDRYGIPSRVFESYSPPVNEGTYAQGYDARDLEDYLGELMAELPAMERSASDILRAAETSGFDYAKIEAALRKHQGSLARTYGDFTRFRQAITAMAKRSGTSMRKAPVKGGRRKSSDISGMDAGQLEDDAKRIMTTMRGVHKQIRKTGEALAREVRRMAEADAGGDAYSVAMEAVVKDLWFPFRDAVYLNFGLIGGLLKRLNARAEMTGDPKISKTAETWDERRAALIERIVKGPIMETTEKEQAMGVDAFEAVAPDGGLLARASSYKDAQTEADKVPGAKVRLVEGRRTLASSLPWANDPDVPDL